MMNRTAWFSFALAFFGPLVGWSTHVLLIDSGHSFLGPAVFLAWSGFFGVRALSSIDWSADTTTHHSTPMSPPPPPYSDVRRAK